MTLTKAIRFYGTGTPEVLCYEDVEVGDPKAGGSTPTSCGSRFKLCRYIFS